MTFKKSCVLPILVALSAAILSGCTKQADNSAMPVASPTPSAGVASTSSAPVVLGGGQPSSATPVSNPSTGGTPTPGGASMSAAPMSRSGAPSGMTPAPSGSSYPVNMPAVSTSPTASAMPAVSTSPTASAMPAASNGAPGAGTSAPAESVSETAFTPHNLKGHH